MSVYNGAGINIQPPQIFYLTIACIIFAIFITLVSTKPPKGPQPATYGHIQTLVNLIDDCVSTLDRREKRRAVKLALVYSTPAVII
jgi:hypothetical protein